jgi:hypothetical protein
MLAAMFALVLVAAACGDDDSQDAGATTTVAEHDHDQTVDVSDLDPTPSVAVEVTEDPMAGWNLRFDATGHELAPEDASTEYVEGEGHAHLYIDGEKQTRLYTEHSFLGELEPGSHEVAVELSANDHRALAVDGEVVMDTVTVEVPEPDGEEHGHGEAERIDASSFEPTPTISVEVAEDPKAGWNLHAEVDGHEFAPESVSTEAVDGEGHAHIYVDGEKLTRLYGAWYFLGDLEPGEREIRVELSANDHSPLAVDGAIVDDTVTIEVPGDDDTADDDDATHAEDTDEADHEHEDGTDGDPVDATAADSTIEVTVTGGSAGGDTGRQETAVGDTVLVRVTSDAADEVHVHGYDHLAAVAPGETAEIQFVADIPGVFEIELEGSGLLLAELAVS